MAQDFDQRVNVATVNVLNSDVSLVDKDTLKSLERNTSSYDNCKKINMVCQANFNNPLAQVFAVAIANSDVTFNEMKWFLLSSQEFPFITSLKLAEKALIDAFNVYMNVNALNAFIRCEKRRDDMVNEFDHII